MSNKHRTVLYIGVTSDLLTRISEHKKHTYARSFTDRYNVVYLVCYETFSSIEEAINREMQIKGWNRKRKVVLVNAMNPEWRDLYGEIQDW